MSKIKSTDGVAPRWLKRTQEGSWEPEILISGIVLLALTQVPRLLKQLHYWLEERTAMFYFYSSNIDDIIFDTLTLSTYWLIAGLIFHLIMRSLWISFVGLSFVYPQGIQTGRLKMQPWFTKRISAIANFEQSIIRLENICSTVYATAFLFVMATISLCIYFIFILFFSFGIIAVFPVVLQMDNWLDIFLQIMSLLIALPYFIDFVTMGWLKRIPWFWRIYRYPYRFMSYITMAPVYRGIYYGLISNINRWRFAGFMLVYVVITYFMVMPGADIPFSNPSVYQMRLGYSAIDGYYRDQPAKRYSTWAHIQSANITEAALQVFLPHIKQFEAGTLKRCPDNLKRLEIADDFPDEHLRNLACLSCVYSFYIAGEPVNSSRFVMRELTHTRQIGLETWIDLSQLPRGHYTLEVKVNGLDYHEGLRASIPFFHAATTITTEVISITENASAATDASDE